MIQHGRGLLRASMVTATSNSQLCDSFSVFHGVHVQTINHFPNSIFVANLIVCAIMNAWNVLVPP